MNNTIPVITWASAYPTILTDRWGDWNHNSENREVKVLDQLEEHYGDGENPNTVDWKFGGGDPRAFMGSNETSFLASHEGKVGILTEVESVYVLDDNAQAQHEEAGDLLMPTADFWHCVENLKAEMAKIQQNYPGSILFLAHEEPTFNGRLTVCAFTPIDKCDGLEYHMLPGREDVIGKLDDALNKLLF